ncbi:phage tail tube protein [Eubacterium pyruvativorans]|uniref:phage tail tube protein n=1 Tax=Eubacterium pyruvativorans TaxID=155865 RepID=UPI00088506FC|nr:phage tail tube protein [Eubacterium pyruvativorans]SDF30581.1 Phage tail tube protein [Eubacterium pyruvativorans]
MPNDNWVTMLGADTVNAHMAKCFITIGDERYNAMNAINVSAKVEKEKKEVPILGQTGKGHKSTSWKGSGSAKFHYNSSFFRRKMLEFMATGEDFYFDMQIINEDPTSKSGRQDITLINCNFDSAVIAAFDADSDDPLEEEMDFTFESVKMGQEFTLLPGMSM